MGVSPPEAVACQVLARAVAAAVTRCKGWDNTAAVGRCREGGEDDQSDTQGGQTQHCCGADQNEHACFHRECLFAEPKQLGGNEPPFGRSEARRAGPQYLTQPIHQGL